MESREKIANIAFYRFVEIGDPTLVKDFFLQLCRFYDLKGTILVAPEGINGMLAGLQKQIDRFIESFKKDDRFSDVLIKWSFSKDVPFKRLLVKVKKEILTLRAAHIEPSIQKGEYIQAHDLQSRLENGEEVVLIDVRNDFEVEYGTFKGAVNPKTKSFSEFSKFAKSLKLDKQKKIVTFCTGGIRCEKGSALLKKEGFTNVSQLEGGILEYLSKTPGTFFEGACFVFDERIALDRNLKPI